MDARVKPAHDGVGMGALSARSAWAKSLTRRANAATLRRAILPSLRGSTVAQRDA
jgi:hypothetical protein